MFQIIAASLFVSHALAQPASNTNYFFNIIDSPLMDVSVRYSSVGTRGDAMETLEFQIYHNANGRITGTAGVQFENSKYGYVAAGPFNGQFNPAGMKITFAQPVVGYHTNGARVRGMYQIAASSVRERGNNDLFVGKLVTRACVSGEGCHTNHNSPWTHLGTWSLVLSLQTFDRTIVGTGNVLLYVGGGFPDRTNAFLYASRRFSYSAYGSFSPVTGKSVIRLVGTQDAVGSRLLVRARDDFRLEKVTGRLLGQRVRSGEE